MNITFGNKGKDHKGYFTRYEIRRKASEPEISDYKLKKELRLFLVDVVCREDQIKSIKRLYQHPTLVAELTNGHRVFFTQYTVH